MRFGGAGVQHWFNIVCAAEIEYFGHLLCLLLYLHVWTHGTAKFQSLSFQFNAIVTCSLPRMTASLSSLYLCWLLGETQQRLNPKIQRPTRPVARKVKPLPTQRNANSFRTATGPTPMTTQKVKSAKSAERVLAPKLEPALQLRAKVKGHAHVCMG